MANHKSAKKRSVQTKVKNAVNSQYLTKIRTNLNKFHNTLKNDDSDEVQKSFRDLNSIASAELSDNIPEITTNFKSSLGESSFLKIFIIEFIFFS